MIEVHVVGRPAPKGSRLTGTSKAGHTYTYPASKFEKPWVDAVKQATQIVMRHHRQPDPPYAVTVEHVIARPKNPRYEYPYQGDIDKLARATIDGLVQGGAMKDDAHVTALTTSKRYARPGEEPGAHATFTTIPASALIAA